MKNWNHQEVEIIKSKGGVIALANPYDNLISTGVTPWPPSEIVQKLYQSRQVRAFAEDQKETLKRFHGYYSDLQSIHSEDAITWSVFGTISHSQHEIQNKFVSEFFQSIDIELELINHSEIYLWRRIPHPDTLVSGGPEIDFGILTEDTLLLGEAKWKSSVSVAQGKNKDKDQIQLRIEFLQKYAPKLYPAVKRFVVLGVGLMNDVINNYVDKNVICIGTTWDHICSLKSHPNHNELLKYLAWKKEYTING